MSRGKAPKAKSRGKKRAKSGVASLHAGRLAAHALAAATTLTLLWIALGLFDGVFWLGALARELAPVLLSVSVTLGVACGLSRRLWLVGALTVGAITLVVQEVPLFRSVKLMPTKGPVLRVAHATLDGSPVEARRISELVREVRPDLFSAVGVTPEAAQVIDAALSTWPGRARALGPKHDRAVWARVALRGAPHEAILRTRVGKCDVQIAVPSIANLTQLSTRPARKQEIAALTEVSDSARAVWLGDLGSRPQADDLSLLLQKQRLRDTRLGHGWLATHPPWLGFLGLATDNILIRGWISVRDRGLRPPLGPGAHKTLVSTLELTEPRCHN